MNKKAEISVLTKALLAIMVLIILVIIFRNQIFPESRIIDNTICGVDADQDNDGVPDLLDDCICLDKTQCDVPGGPEKCKKEREDACSKA